MTDAVDPFMAVYDGALTGIQGWEDLDALWQAMAEQSGDQRWYVYAVGEPPPVDPVDRERLADFVTRLDELLRRDHDESYCGIVYADDPLRPSFIKVYDPNHLGSSCGSSGHRVLPGWILSTLRPVDLPAAFPLPGGRRRWWLKWLGG